MPDLKTRSRHEAALAGAALLLFRRWKPSVITRTFDREAFVSDFADTIGPRLARTHRDAFDQLTGAHDVDSAHAGEELSERFGNRYAQKLGKAIAKDLDVAIDRAAEESENNAHRAEILNDLAKESLNAARAGKIGVTETTRAISAGEHDARKRIFDATGKLLRPKWYTEDDGDVCEICEPLHGKDGRSWRRRFPLGPPAHPNCRCWLEYDE